ncbi:MAG TPA: AMP-binding protein, partial [Candidatus Dormibacteraeota bacterium]|nr:AMP-binding protein [Candidatus Dormibacteraeota bacterium]
MTEAVWVGVESRAELEEARRRRSGDVFVVPARTPVYGRPGDTLCVALEGSDLVGQPPRIVAALPVRAGVLVPASAAGLAVLREAKRRGRAPLAARVGDPGEAKAAVEAGAEYLVAPPSVAVPDGVARVKLDVKRRAATGLADRAAATVLGGTFGTALQQAVRASPDSEAVVTMSGPRFTYAQLKSDAEAVARALLASGVKHGDRVAVIAGNVSEWPAIQLGCGLIGAILVPVNPRRSAEEIAFVLQQSGSRLQLPVESG